LKYRDELCEGKGPFTGIILWLIDFKSIFELIRIQL
jgi:hypothetical protein